MNRGAESIAGRESHALTWQGSGPTKLVSCSADRTLIARSVDGDAWELVKIYERGSMAEAEAEAGMGQLIDVEGIVRCRAARRDPFTHKPSVVMEFHAGTDLGRWLARHGPLEPGLAARIARRIARALADLHALSVPGAASGVVHRDVKPSNVLLVGDEIDPAHCDVMLLDLEHALPAAEIAPGAGSGLFSGGTHGFAPPEAYRGSPPSTAFDVFGFGVTLHSMLTGVSPFGVGPDSGDIADRFPGPEATPEHPLRGVQGLRGVPGALREIAVACLQADPAARPTMAEVRGSLHAYLTADGAEDRELDHVLVAIHAAELDAAGETLAQTPGTGPRHRDLGALLRRRRRLVERLTMPARWSPGASASAERAQRIAAELPRLAAWLQRFPGCQRLLEMRRDLEHALADLVADIPREVAGCKRAAEFDRAEELLQRALAAVHAAERMPNAVPVSATPGQAAPGPLQRDPGRFFELALRDLEQARRTHGELVGQLRSAEEQLDLDQAEHVLESAASVYSGASDVVAALKDRSHRFGFYLERIAQPAPVLDLLSEQLMASGIDADLTPVLELQQLCVGCLATRHFEAPDRPHDSLRGLQRTLHDLLDEFPHIEPVAGGAVAALDRAFEVLTRKCWELIGDAHSKLDAVPIPIRPLQSIVSRIDTLRRMDVLVDLPQGSRTSLLDGLERLRIKVDQARTTRDRIARGAEEAMEKGHLTTALFDMARAVDQYSGETDELEGSGRRLAAQLQEAKRKKEAIEDAARRNMELAARQATLHDDPDSTYEQRLEVLEQRKQLLLFLTHNLQAERVSPYQTDLRDIEMEILREHDEHGSARLARATDPDEREQLARATHECISVILDERTVPLPPRAGRLAELWEERLAGLRRQREERQAAQRRERRQSRRRRLALLAAPPTLGIAFLAGLLATGVLGSDTIGQLDADLAGALPQTFAPEPPNAFDAIGACIELDAFLRRLESSRLQAAGFPATLVAVHRARELLDAVRAGLGRRPPGAGDPWPPEFRDAVRRYDASLGAAAPELRGHDAGSGVLQHLRRFGARAIEAGVLGAGIHRDPEVLHHLVGQLADLHEIELPQAVRDLGG